MFNFLRRILGFLSPSFVTAAIAVATMRVRQRIAESSRDPEEKALLNQFADEFVAELLRQLIPPG